jgi:hypothetical protein
MNDPIHNITPTHLRRRRASLPRRAATAATATVAAILALAALPLHALVVWQDDFSGSAIWWIPAVTNSTATRVDSAGNPSPSLRINDASTTEGIYAIAELQKMTAFDTSQPDQSVLKLAFDMRIDAWSGSGANTPRVSLYSPTAASIITIAFGRVRGDGADQTLYNTLYANVGGSTNPFTTTAVGYNPETGTWNEGFAFGTHDETVSTNNTTGGFLHFELTYINQSTTALLTVTNGEHSASLTIKGIAPATWNSTGGSSPSVRINAPGAGTADFYVDNFLLTVSALPPSIPEPATFAALAAAVALLAAAGRKSRVKNQENEPTPASHT